MDEYLEENANSAQELIESCDTENSELCAKIENLQKEIRSKLGGNSNLVLELESLYTRYAYNLATYIIRK